jgi:hypothetical protein
MPCAHRNERRVQGLVENHRLWRRQLRELVTRKDEGLAERVSLDLPWKIARESGCLLAAVAEQESLAAFVRVQLARLLGWELRDELLPHEVGERLLALRCEVHDLQGPTRLRAAGARGAHPERRRVGDLLGRVVCAIAESNAGGLCARRLEHSSRLNVDQERLSGPPLIGMRLL